MLALFVRIRKHGEQLHACVCVCVCVCDEVKCHQYYPVGSENEGDDEMVFNDVGLKVTFINEQHTSYHFTTRILHLLDLQVCHTPD